MDSTLCIHLRPLPRLRIVRCAIPAVQLRDLRHQWIIRVCVRQKTQNAQQHLRDRECRAPLVLEDVQTDAARRVDIRMEDLGLEGHDRRLEGIVTRKADAQVEDAALEGRVRGAEDHGLPVEEVVLIYRTGRTVCRRVLLDLSVFTLKSACCHRTGRSGVGGRPSSFVAGRGVTLPVIRRLLQSFPKLLVPAGVGRSGSDGNHVRTDRSAACAPSDQAPPVHTRRPKHLSVDHPIDEARLATPAVSQWRVQSRDLSRAAACQHHSAPLAS